jgi:hypothetical protein
MADMRLAVGRWRTIIERKGIAAFTLVDCFLGDIILLSRTSGPLFHAPRNSGWCLLCYTN